MNWGAFAHILEEECPDGLWYGAREGNWIVESKALSMLWRRIGYRNDCSCIPKDDWRWAPPIHYDTRQVMHPRWHKINGDPDFGVTGAPFLRGFSLERECSGRFTRSRFYLWRPDVEKWIEWYVQHITEDAEQRLGGKTYEEVG